MVHMYALNPSTPVGLDLQALRESGCYPGSCSMFGKYRLNNFGVYRCCEVAWYLCDIVI